MTEASFFSIVGTIILKITNEDPCSLTTPRQLINVSPAIMDRVDGGHHNGRIRTVKRGSYGPSSNDCELKWLSTECSITK